MVGAGGLGFQIVASLRILQYRDVLTCLAVVLVMVTLVDQVGGRIRARIVRP
jgi:phosphonate transport system permease protein